MNHRFLRPSEDFLHVGAWAFFSDQGEKPVLVPARTICNCRSFGLKDIVESSADGFRQNDQSSL